MYGCKNAIIIATIDTHTLFIYIAAYYLRCLVNFFKPLWNSLADTIENKCWGSIKC